MPKRHGGSRQAGRRTLLIGLAVCLATGYGAAASAQPPTPTSTPSPTSTATVTPTSCRGALPVVEAVTSPTNALDQTIFFCGRIVGGSNMSAFTEAGAAQDIRFADRLCSFPCFGNASCNQGTVPLLPNQINHVTVCQGNFSCSSGGCVTVDVSGNPLEIVQVQPTPRAIPLVASPGTPAGIALVGLLLAAMSWLLRRARV